jgi:oligopeptide transport system substrate-binding protein
MKIKISSAIVLIALFITSCGGEERAGKTQKNNNGDIFYGGVFRLNEVEDFRSLFPLSISDAVSFRVGNQIYEGLIKLSQKDLSILPAIAEKWIINEDATSFTFYIRKGVKFHDDAVFPEGKGREVKAQDVKFCFEMLCSDIPENQGFWIFRDRVVGATEYFNSTTEKKPLKEGVTGIKIIDDFTVQIDLKYPFSGFMYVLSTPLTWVFPKEAFDTYGLDMRIKCVGTGPFTLKNIKEGQAIVLEKNPNYWDVDEYGNKLPYLDAIKISFLKEKKSELLEFRRGNLDMIYRLPVEMIKDVTAEFQNAKQENRPFELQNVPFQSVFFYGFQHSGTIFNNKNIRQAFNYAIDRESLVTYTLQGDGVPAYYGIVPPAYSFYDTKKLRGYSFDPEKAKALLAEAGYPNGKGFPKLSITINSGGGDRNIQTAEVMQKMLKQNLNIDVKIDVIQFAQHLEAMETGASDFFRATWIADYPDPENYLNLLYGGHIPAKNEKSYINFMRYNSPKFDSLFRSAQKEVDQVKRYELFLQAEQVAIDDAAFLPVFYDENTRLLQIYVRNLDINSLEYRDFSRVYIDQDIRDKEIVSNQ